MAAVLWVLAGLCGAGALWLAFGRWIVRPVDGVLLRAGVELAVTPLAINSDRFVIATRSWPFAEALGLGVTFAVDGMERLVLTVGGAGFVLGPVGYRLRCVDGMQYEFTPEAGDVVSFRLRPSWLSWPTPFHFSVMGVRGATWRRRSYYCLSWTKADGRRLEIVWEDGQGFFKGAGWREGYADRLVRVAVS